MKAFVSLIVMLTSLVKAQPHGEEATKEMGPVAFMWPPDRTWGAAYDNNAPCGSVSGVVNRTEFPMVNGQLALVTQDESWNVQIAVSDKNNPTTNDDFETIVAARRISDIDPGHMCYPVPNPGIDTEEGMNATFQIRYTSDFDTDKNETYYACADVTYVPASKFTYQVPCFNVTIDEFTPTNGTASDGDTEGSGSGASSSDSTTHDSNTSSSGGGSGLSGGAIAGVVVGCVAAVTIAAILLFGYRRLLQKYRSLRQRTSVRNIDADLAAEAGKPTADNSSESASSYGLRKLRSPGEADSSDSDSSSGSSDNEVISKQETKIEANRPLENAKQRPWSVDEESAEGSDIKDLLDTDTESHSNMMTAALLEFYCLTRAADLLNRQHGSHKRYTRDSPEVQFLGKKMYSHKSKFLSSHGVIAEGIDSEKWGSTRQYYRDNLDALGLSALEGLDIGGDKRKSASIEATGNLVLASKSVRDINAHTRGQATGKLRLEGPTVGPLDLRERPGGERMSALEDFHLDPRRIPRPLLPLTGSSPTSFPLFELNPTTPNTTMSRYAVEFTEIKTVGRGSFGEVYHVKNHIDGQDYAVKKIPLSQRRLEQLQCGNENQLENIMKEIRTLARLEHANVVRYYGAWIEQTHFPRLPFTGQQNPANIEYEQTQDSEPDQPSGPGDDSFGVVFEHSQESQLPSTAGDSIDSHGSHDVSAKSHSSEKPLSSSVEDDVESIPRNFSDPTCSQLSTFGASDGDIFTDGLSHDQSRMQLQRRHRNGDAVPAVVLHIQMSLHPIPLSSYLSQQATDDSQTLLRRHCYHLVPSLKLILNIIAGVDYLHSKGIIHRDLKPANIFLSCSEDRNFKECLPCMSKTGACSKFCHPRIGDFGLVADISHMNDCSSANSPVSTGQNTPKLNRVVGTEFYCPPFFQNADVPDTGSSENFNYSIDESLDVYALGVILFELVYRINTKMERQMVLTGLTRGVQTDSGLERPSFPPDFEQKVDCAEVVLRSGETIADALKVCIRGMLGLSPSRHWRCSTVQGYLEKLLNAAQDISL
ncbi:putative protein kinase [Aspergillus undulatus]|uniref:putative protein kinase n=1 Tax=Aspergillus undulatus TaxID=1810928 RepID=UPI003CCE4CDC